MTSPVGWYTGLIDVGSVADIKAGTTQTQQPTVFYWSSKNARPTAASANITGLVAVTGGPFPSKAAAIAAAEGSGSPGLPGTGTPKSQSVSSSTVNSANGHLPSIANPLDWLSNIGQFFSALTQANTWLRVSKVLMGGVLVVAGLLKLTGTSPTVYGIAGMAAKKLTTAVEGGGK